MFIIHCKNSSLSGASNNIFGNTVLPIDLLRETVIFCSCPLRVIGSFHCSQPPKQTPKPPGNFEPRGPKFWSNQCGGHASFHGILCTRKCNLFGLFCWGTSLDFLRIWNHIVVKPFIDLEKCQRAMGKRYQDRPFERIFVVTGCVDPQPYPPNNS